MFQRCLSGFRGRWGRAGELQKGFKAVSRRFRAFQGVSAEFLRVSEVFKNIVIRVSERFKDLSRRFKAFPCLLVHFRRFHMGFMELHRRSGEFQGCVFFFEVVKGILGAFQAIR